MSSVLQIPGYGQGFARCQAECEYPELWKGLVGSWAPYLGSTGTTLRDWSGHGNHGTLTSMDPATDWVASQYGWAIDVAYQQWITLDKTISLTGARTIIYLARVDTLEDLWAIPVGHDSSNWAGRQSGVLSRVRSSGGGPNFTYGSEGSGNWEQTAFTFDGGSEWKMYVDNILRDTQSHASGAMSVSRFGSWWDDYDHVGSHAYFLIYARCLSASELQLLYERPHAIHTLHGRVFLAVTAGGHFGPKVNRQPLFSKLQGLAG